MFMGTYVLRLLCYTLNYKDGMPGPFYSYTSSVCSYTDDRARSKEVILPLERRMRSTLYRRTPTPATGLPATKNTKLNRRESRRGTLEELDEGVSLLVISANNMNMPPKAKK